MNKEPLVLYNVKTTFHNKIKNSAVFIKTAIFSSHVALKFSRCAVISSNHVAHDIVSAFVFIDSKYSPDNAAGDSSFSLR